MPTYRITDPEGKAWKVTGNGSKAQALERFRGQWKPSAEREPAAGMGAAVGGAVRRFGEGLKEQTIDPVSRLYRGMEIPGVKKADLTAYPDTVEGLAQQNPVTDIAGLVTLPYAGAKGAAKALGAAAAVRATKLDVGAQRASDWLLKNVNPQFQNEYVNAAINVPVGMASNILEQIPQFAAQGIAAREAAKRVAGPAPDAAPPRAAAQGGPTRAEEGFNPPDRRAVDAQLAEILGAQAPKPAPFVPKPSGRSILAPARPVEPPATAKAPKPGEPLVKGAPVPPPGPESLPAFQRQKAPKSPAPVDEWNKTHPQETPAFQREAAPRQAAPPLEGLDAPTFMRKPQVELLPPAPEAAPKGPVVQPRAVPQDKVGNQVIVEGFEQLGPGKVTAATPGGTEITFRNGRTVRVNQSDAIRPYAPTEGLPLPLQEAPAPALAPAPAEAAPAPAPAPEAPAPRPQSRIEQQQEASAAKMLGAPRVEAQAQGKVSKVMTPLGKHDVTYKLVALDDLKPSHDSTKGYARTPDYPDWVQPRDYSGNRAYQLDVEANSTSDRFDPAGQIFDTTSSAISGPPITMPDGTVLGGNGRTMTIKLAAQRPETLARYREALAAAAANFGIDQAQVQRMFDEGRTPIIVREYQNAPADVQRLRQLGEEFNKDIKKAADPAEQAFTRGSLISEGSLQKLAEIMGEDESLARVLSTSEGSSAVARALLDDRVISQNELNALVNPKTGAFNEQGAGLIRDAVAARLIGDLNLFKAMPGKLKDRLVKGAGELVRIEASQPEWHVADKLREGVEWIMTQQSNGIDPADWFNTQDMFKTLDPDAKVMAQLMIKPMREIQQRLKIYADQAPREVKPDVIPGQDGFDFMNDIPSVQPKAAMSQMEAFQRAFMDPLPGKGDAPQAPPASGGGGVFLASDPFGARASAELVKRMYNSELMRKLPKTFAEVVRRTAELENQKVTKGFAGFEDVNRALNLPEHRGELKGAIGTLKFLADPSHVIPRMAQQAGRVYDAMNRTKSAFLTEIGSATKGLKPEDHFRLYEALDGQVEPGQLPTNLQQPYVRLRNVLDKIADMEGLPVGNRLADYFPHISEKSGVIALPDDGIFVKPGENPFHKHRAGSKDYTYDLLEALTVRTAVGTRKAFMKPFVEAVMPRVQEMPENVRKYTEAYLDVLQGRPRPITQRTEWLLSQVVPKYVSGQLANAQTRLNLQYYRGLLGLAFDTSLKNLAQGGNTLGELGTRRVARGLYEMMTPSGREAFKKAGVLDDYLNVVDQQADLLSKGKWTKGLDAVLFAPMKFSEYINRGVAFHAGMAKASELGLKGPQAVEYAKFLVDKTQFRYGSSNTSPYLQNPIGKMFMQFSTYPLKQSQFLAQLAKDPNKMKLARYLAYTGLISGLGAAAGINTANAVGWNWHNVPFTGDKEQDKPKAQVPLPTGPFAQLGGSAATLFSAPGPRTLASGAQVLGSAIKGESNDKAVREFVRSAKGLIPAWRIASKIDKFKREQETGYAWSEPTEANPQGKPLYPISRGESAAKLLGFTPEVTEKHYAK